MTLQEFCNSLSKKKQIELAIVLIEKALPLWNQFAEQNELKYIDSVVGMNHQVPKKLIPDTINEIKKYATGSSFMRLFKSKTKLVKMRTYYDDPVIAMQDFDWELPYCIERIFYSTYNLLETILGKEYASFNERTIFVAINQAIDALDTGKVLSEKEIKEILNAFKTGDTITWQS